MANFRTNYRRYLEATAPFYPLDTFLAYDALNELIKHPGTAGDAGIETTFIAEVERVNQFYEMEEKIHEENFSAIESMIKAKSLPIEERVAKYEIFEKAVTNLLKFVALNRTGFSKLLRKKRLNPALSTKLEPILLRQYFLTSTVADKLLLAAQKELKLLARRADQANYQEGDIPLDLITEEDDTLLPRRNTPESCSGVDARPSTWAFILGTLVQQLADNANKLFVPLVLLQLTSIEAMAILSGFLTGAQAFGALMGGTICEKFNPRSVLVNLVYIRTVFALIVASAYTAYSMHLISGAIALAIIGVVSSVDWCMRGVVDTTRNILPMAFSQMQVEALEKLNTQFFLVFELGALAGPAIQGIFLAAGLNLAATGWIPFAGFVVNCIVDLWIPKLDATMFKSPKHQGRPGLCSKVGQFFGRFGTSLGLIWKLNIFNFTIMILLFQVYRIRSIIPQIIAVDLFKNESYSAWLFCMYAGGNVVGSFLYGWSRKALSLQMQVMLSVGGCAILGLSWLDFYHNGTVLFVTCMVGAGLFAIVNMTGRTALQTQLQLALKGSGHAANIMGMNRFFVTVYAMLVRFLIGFFFLDASDRSFMYLSGFVLLSGVLLLACTGVMWFNSAKHSKGVLVVFEGLDGAGKSTQVRRLKESLQRQRFVLFPTAWSRECVHYEYIKFLKREKVMRSALLTIVQSLELKFLIYAHIAPAVRANRIVISDRYYFTGVARGVARGFRRDWLTNLFDISLQPDLVCYVRAPPSLATDRVLDRSKQGEPSLSDDVMTHKVAVNDTFVSVYEAGLDVGNPVLSVRENFVSFQTKVSSLYDHFSDSSTGAPWLVVDASDTRDSIHQQISDRVTELLRDTPCTLAKYTSTVFDNDPVEDSTKLHNLCCGRDGFHWFYRKSMAPMRVRVGQMFPDRDIPKVYLHGNPHLNNYAMINEKGSCMIDFDRSCNGPYVWDIIRFLGSVLIKKQDAEIDFTLSPGYLRAFRRGYKWGVRNPNQPFQPMKLTDAFSRPAVPGRFFEKRRKIMQANPIDPKDSRIRGLINSYAKALEQDDFLSKHEILEAGQTHNWNGRERNLILLKPTDPTVKKPSSGFVLLDIKPCIHDKYSGAYTNPFPNSQALRMQIASKLYAPNFYIAQTGFQHDGVEYFGRRVPEVNLKLKLDLNELEYKDMMFSIGTQLGVAHAKTMQCAVDQLLTRFENNFDKMVKIVHQCAEELSGAHQRYIEKIRNGARSNDSV